MLSTYLQQPIHSSSSRYDVDGNGSIEFAEMKRVNKTLFQTDHHRRRLLLLVSVSCSIISMRAIVYCRGNERIQYRRSSNVVTC